MLRKGGSRSQIQIKIKMKILKKIAAILLVLALVGWLVWELGGFHQRHDEAKAIEIVQALPDVVPDTVRVLGNPIDGGPMPKGGPIYIRFGVKGDSNRSSRTAVVVDGKVERQF